MGHRHGIGPELGEGVLAVIEPRAHVALTRRRRHAAHNGEAGGGIAREGSLELVGEPTLPHHDGPCHQLTASTGSTEPGAGDPASEQRQHEAQGRCHDEEEARGFDVEQEAAEGEDRDGSEGRPRDALVFLRAGADDARVVGRQCQQGDRPHQEQCFGGGRSGAGQPAELVTEREAFHEDGE